MSTFENVVQSAAEKLMEDERLRASLTDEEANLVINWATEWLEGRVANAKDEATARETAQAEVTRLRPAMQKISDLLTSDQVPALPAAVKALGLPSSKAKASNVLDRKAFIRTVTAQLAEVWRKQ